MSVPPFDWRLEAATATAQAATWPGQRRTRTAETAYEWLTGGAIAAALICLGAPIGLLWASLRPTLKATVVLGAAESALKPQFDADLTLAGIGAAVGLLAGVAVWARVRDHALGAVVGLGVGGVLSMVVAAQVGAMAAHPDHLPAQISATLPPGARLPTGSSGNYLLSLFRFELHSHSVVVVMALFATFSYAVAASLRDRTVEIPLAAQPNWGSVDSARAPELAQLSAWKAAPSPDAAGPPPPAGGLRW